jgi:hypothetical protein
VRLEHEVDDIRSNIDDIVGELDRRRHDFFDWRLQLRRHAATLGLLAITLVAATAGVATFVFLRNRRRSKPMARAKRLREAFSRAIEHPERLVRPPSVGQKALSSAASAFAGTLAKATAEQVATGITRTLQ